MTLSLINFKIDDSALDLSKELPFKVYSELSDLYGFANFTKEQIEIDFDFSGQKLQLKKDYSKGTVDLYIDGTHTFQNLFEYISKVSGKNLSQSDLNAKEINIQNALSIEDFKTLLEQKNIYFEKSNSDLDKHQLHEKVKEYETKMDFIIESEGKANKDEEELERLRTLDTEVKDYIIIQNAIKDDLSFYNNEVNNNLNGKNINQLKAERLSGEQKFEISNKIANFLVRKDEDDFSFRAKGLLILILLQFLVTVGLYFGSFSKAVILVGLFGLIFQILNLIILNLLEPPADLQLLYDKELEVEPVITEASESEDEVFVKSAWSKALEAELHKLQSSISNILHGKTYDDFRTELDNKSKNIAKTNAEIITTALNSMSREDYKALKQKLLAIDSAQNPSPEIASNTGNVYNEVMPLFIVSAGSAQAQLVQQIKEFFKENSVAGQVFYVKQ